MGTQNFFQLPVRLGGARRDRTADLLHAMQALSQLSYSPKGAAHFTDAKGGCQAQEILLVLLSAALTSMS